MIRVKGFRKLPRLTDLVEISGGKSLTQINFGKKCGRGIAVAGTAVRRLAFTVVASYTADLQKLPGGLPTRFVYFIGVRNR